MVVGDSEWCRWYLVEYLGEYIRGCFVNPSPDKIKEHHDGIIAGTLY